MNESSPVVLPFFAQANSDGGSWSGNLLDDPRFRGLLFMLEFQGSDLVQYAVKADSGPLPTATVLRQVPIDHLRRIALADIQRIQSNPTEASPSIETAEDRADLDGPMDDWYVRPPSARELKLARLAERYVALLSERSPTKALVDESDYERDYVDQMLKEARDAGLLTRPPRRGVAGGALTARAIEILTKAEDD